MTDVQPDGSWFHSDGWTVTDGLTVCLGLCTDGWMMINSLTEWSHDGQMVSGWTCSQTYQ